MASKAKKVAAKKPVKKVAAKQPVAKKAVAKKTAKPVAKKAAKTVSKKAAVKASTKAVKKTAAKKPVKVAAKTLTTKKVAAKTSATSAKKSAAKTAPTKASVKPASKKMAVPVLTTAKPAIKNLDYSKAITPLGDRLVLRVVEAAKMTAGGLYIPDMVNEAVGHLKGEVLAVGGGGKSKKGAVRPLDVQVGDYVLFAEYAGTKIEFNAQELQIVHEADVMGIVQK